ncbi:uncharacterized protein N7511_002866 [Penicillium nucicola]|uniref:uncharacterized protein n=1 Tax=Penicillium nucicola TaxID=1850975 RepID=UPI00254599A5|nr:uncharacterized protein N7511_002866 [Penicillium nucicola]KAJ5770815.1 hypothetical protein N7511_002866 [Penicillium nucicola]
MPKRKAPSRISGLLGSDDEDLLQVGQTDAQETHNEPPAKKRRGRPRTSHDDVNAEPKPKPKPATRAKKQKEVAEATEEAPAPKKRGRPAGNSRVSQSQEPEPRLQTAATEEMEMDNHAQDQENEDPQQRKKTNAAKPAPARRGRAAANAKKDLQTDNGFEYTPRADQKTSASEEPGEHPSPSPQLRGKGRRAEPEVEETQQGDEPTREVVDETILPIEPASKRYITSPVKKARARASLLRHPPDSSPRKRKLGETEQGGDPELRRRLGELSKKHDALEAKFRNLREIGIVEANANMDKLRRQSETVTTASNELVASLKAELEVQRKLGQQSRGLQKQLNDRDTEMARLKSQADEAQAQLASAQTEVKALQTKLAAARNTAASIEGAAKVPGSAIKGGPANRANAAASAEAAQAAQLAQLKEDLYSDLTGLIVRDVKTTDTDHVYDCIQTGINGTLHFHLAIPKTSTNYDNTEIQYLPLLDANRDRDLVNLLPNFLVEDITFSRGQAAKFYTRVIDALTKRRSLPAQ